MHFAFTEEHEELRRTVRRFLDDRSDEQAVRRAMETERGYDDDTWSQMAGQMGRYGEDVYDCDSSVISNAPG